MTLFPTPLLASEQDESIKAGNASTTSGIYQIFSGGKIPYYSMQLLLNWH